MIFTSFDNVLKQLYEYVFMQELYLLLQWSVETQANLCGK